VHFLHLGFGIGNGEVQEGLMTQEDPASVRNGLRAELLPSISA
jgi:hypothetical protein